VQNNSHDDLLICKDQGYVEESWKYLHIVGKLLITT